MQRMHRKSTRQCTRRRRECQRGVSVYARKIQGKSAFRSWVERSTHGNPTSGHRLGRIVQAHEDSERQRCYSSVLTRQSVSGDVPVISGSLITSIAIDVWAAGVILLSILCQKFPVFVSGDDMEALLEIGCIFGQAQLEKAAHLHSESRTSAA